MDELGVISKTCYAINIKDKNNELLRTGILIKISKNFEIKLCTRVNECLTWSEETYSCEKKYVVVVKLKLFQYLLAIEEPERVSVSTLTDSKKLSKGLELSEGDSCFLKGHIFKESNGVAVEMKIIFIGEVPEVALGNVLGMVVVNDVSEFLIYIILNPVKPYRTKYCRTCVIRNPACTRIT